MIPNISEGRPFRFELSHLTEKSVARVLKEEFWRFDEGVDVHALRQPGLAVQVEVLALKRDALRRQHGRRHQQDQQEGDYPHQNHLGAGI